MSTDPYQVLGVEKSVTADELQKKYRRLAKKLHPDLNPGNKSAEEKFKEVAAAYGLLSDVDRRASFDRGEIDASGAERQHQPFYRDFAQGNASAHPYARNDGFADLHESESAEGLFSELFARARAGNRAAPGSDVLYRLELDFLEAVNGGKRLVTLADGNALDVAIPAGTRDAQTLRLRGKGLASAGSGPPGDALIEIHVRAHRLFTRKGNDIHLDLPISIIEAVQGGKINVPTPSGPVLMTIPKGTNSGRVLRLKGKGVSTSEGGKGDAYVTLNIMLPATSDPELEKFIAQWRPEIPYNPRQEIEG